MARQLGRARVRWLLTDVVVQEGSCLKLTTLDWTRTDDLKTQEEYQHFLVSTEVWSPDDMVRPYSKCGLTMHLYRIGTDISSRFEKVLRISPSTCSEDSCLNLTRDDWTRPDDLKTEEEYQLTAVMILNPTRPDVRVLRNLVTSNFSPLQTSKSDDLKTQRICLCAFLRDLPPIYETREHRTLT
ncbi:hypothetical protein Bbelb_250620 [Branchiostoma belcheri]|nr:hypothetical protein Bbelb_250620 [Branchiostoma belcheri]